MPNFSSIPDDHPSLHPIDVHDLIVVVQMPLPFVRQIKCHYFRHSPSLHRVTYRWEIYDPETDAWWSLHAYAACTRAFCYDTLRHYVTAAITQQAKERSDLFPRPTKRGRAGTFGAPMLSRPALLHSTPAPIPSHF